jgi:hypothetical protein
MADMGDYWRDVTPALKERSQQKRASNRQQSAKMLTDAKVKFESRNGGAHLIVTAADGLVADFWPGTGKWMQRGYPGSSRGVRSLLRFCKEHSK